jgi:hypothetical protein
VTTEIAPDTNNDKMLVAYDAFQPFKLPAPGTPWPEATAFIGIDAVAINYVANRNMPSPSGSGGCEVPNLSWDYALTLSPLVTISPGGGNRIEMTVNASGSASVTWHTPGILPNVSFSVSVAGSAAALGQISVDPDGANQDVNLRIVGAGQFDLSANLDGVPTGLIPGLDAGIDALLDMMSAAAVAILEDHVFTVYSLAPIRFDLLGNPGMLAPRKFTLNQSTGDGVPLVVVTGHPVFMAAT